MKKILLTGLMSIVMLVFLAGCSAATQKTADDDKPKSVNGRLTKAFHLKVVTPTDFNEMIIADKKGFFKEVGIIPEYTGSVPSGSLAQSVIKGDNHLFGSGHPSNIAAAIVHPPYNKIARNRGGLDVLTTSYQIGELAGNGALSGLAVRAFSEDLSSNIRM